ncbi:MAG TPA: DUF5679 domain-containing protein [Dehalococcoidales bacterium]|nr:DUF5679 domain-containing protein [Dehalococcoidales bacterium]
MQAYCVKCRAKKEMKDAKKITMKNGKSDHYDCQNNSNLIHQQGSNM